MLNEVLAEVCRRYGARLAVADRAQSLSYEELASRAGNLAGQIPTGARVGLCATNSVDLVVAYAAVLRAGAVPFLVDRAMGPAELDHIIGSCALDLVVHDRPLPPDHRAGTSRAFGSHTLTPYSVAPRARLLDTTEVCRFTSGSTGFPQCIEFSGDAVHSAAANWMRGTGLGGDDRVLCYAGLSNGLAFNTSLLAVFLAGASLHLATGLPAAGSVVRSISGTAATRLTGFPALYDSLARRTPPPGTFADIRVAVSSGARLSTETAELLRERCGLHVSDYYGIAETGPLTFATGQTGGLGAPLPGVGLRTGAGGELLVRSASMGSRYHNAPGVFEAKLDADGYYRTGDLGHLDRGGLVLTGRISHVLNVGGRKIDPIEVRRVLCELPGVDDAVVFGAAKPGGDDMVVAVVASRAAVTAAELRTGCFERLAAFKVPERVHVVETLPRNSIGKPTLAAVRAIAGVSEH
ncbi:class I adenylate-forming enzyme family protein [Lentzea sp. NPDC006480]|uniref:class I adenylate-forming enzyme family protein n=1 Tax=Lentzea sp. NPDC006480 TaxID=3157176 RepID=UPI0033B73C68